MKKTIILLVVLFPIVFFAQSARDINIVIQKTIDLHALKKHFNESEVNGETPLIILTNKKMPRNLIIIKFKKRVKIMTPTQLKTFKSIHKGNLDSYFVFEIMEFNEDEVTVKATFRKTDRVAINANMKKQNEEWLVSASSAG